MSWDDYAINLRLEKSGQVLEINRAYSLTGVEASAYAIGLQSNALLDGATLTENNIEPREIAIAAVCETKTRDFIVRFLNPKDDLKLIVKMYDTERWISGRVTEFFFVNNHVSNKNAFELTLTCPDPFFRDMDDFGKNIANIVPQFAFPFISPIAGWHNEGATKRFITGHQSGYKQFLTKLTLNNRGDVEAGVQFTIKANGTVVNPCVTLNDTGQHIRLNDTLAQGSVLTINTARGEKRIEIDGQNAFHKIDRNSDLFLLAVGNNEIEYDADGGKTEMDVYVYYTPRYLGI